MHTPLQSPALRCAFLGAFAILAFATVQSFAGPVGEFDDESDIGNPQQAGSASYDPGAQQYAIAGGGANIWAGHDQFHFVWKKLNGDFLLRTRVQFTTESAEPHRKVGWQIRASLDPDAPYVDVAAHGNGEIALQFRPAAGTATRQFVLPVTHADVLQLERRGQTYIVSAARWGDTFTSNQISNVNLGDAVYVGLFVCAHNPTGKEQATFRDVRITKPVKVGFAPYHDYIGSNLEILDVQTGQLQLIYRSAEPFEAPNWTRDGTRLIYNVSGSGPNKGLLRRFDLAQRHPEPLDTGNATHNNNDHVLSFDGTRLGISNQGPESGNKSSVWILPSTGGKPRQMTPLTPSYFHSWSPDGKWLVYTGGRQENGTGPTVFSIYKMSSGGGEEIRLTRGNWLDDGPEFSPDGKYIYFNSTRSGLMQPYRSVSAVQYYGTHSADLRLFGHQTTWTSSCTTPDNVL